MGDKKTTTVNAVIFSVVTYGKTTVIVSTENLNYEVLTYGKVQEARLTNEFINIQINV